MEWRGPNPTAGLLLVGVVRAGRPQKGRKGVKRHSYVQTQRELGQKQSLQLTSNVAVRLKSTRLQPQIWFLVPPTNQRFSSLADKTGADEERGADMMLS